MGASAGLQGSQGTQVAFGQVHHIDIVAHAGAVGCGVVVSENRKFGQLAHRNLGNVGQQVVGYAVWIFTDQAAFVGAHRVEVTQDGNSPSRVRRRHVVTDRRNGANRDRG
jgi:hypothetical protein